MKKWVLSLTLAAGVIGLAACSSGNGETVVKSNAGDISKEELYEAMKERVGDQVLQQLVIEKVLSKDYKVSDEDLDKKFEEIKAQVGPQFPMAIMEYGYKDEEDFRQSLRLSLLQEKAATKDIKITDEELKEYYENKQKEVEVRHIIVADEETAKEIKTKLDAGEDFAALAKEYSQDGTAEQGGSLGFIKITDPMDPKFKEVAFNLNKDEMSEAVQSQFGWHIIQVTDIKEIEDKDKKKFEDVKAELESELKASKLDPSTVEQAVKTELEKAKIKVEDKELKASFDQLLNAEDPAKAVEEEAKENK